MENFTTHRFQPDPQAKDYCLCGWHHSADCHEDVSLTAYPELARLQRENAELRAKLEAAERDTARLRDIFESFEGIWTNQQLSTLAVAKAMLDASKKALAIYAAMDAKERSLGDV